MSMFEDNRYRWRETYFVLFDVRSRPRLKTVSETLAALNPRYELTQLNADEDGLIDSLTLISPDDFAAMDVCYIEGEEVFEQSVEMIKELKRAYGGAAPPVSWKQLQEYAGRLDVLHFERILEETGDDLDEDDGDMLNPSALLIVLNALATLTGGVIIDPQAGMIMLNDD